MIDYNPKSLRTDDQVTVVGDLNAAGELVAEQLNFKLFVESPQICLRGLANNIDALNQRLNAFGVGVLTGEETTYFDVSQDDGLRQPPPNLGFNN